MGWGAAKRGQYEGTRTAPTVVFEGDAVGNECIPEKASDWCTNGSY